MLTAMRRKSAFAALVLGGLSSASVGAQPAAAPPAAAPTAPAAAAAPAPQPRAPQASPAAPAPVMAAPREPAGIRGTGVDPRSGIARLEREGRTLGFGAVLRADGRILTALSALGHGNDVKARFSDDSVLPVRVVASDRVWDLALLAPQGGHWTEGLRPSVLDVADPGTPLGRFKARGQRLEMAPVTLRARQGLLGRDGVILTDALVFAERLDEAELGSPLLDRDGEVAGLLVQACAPGVNERCQLAAFGAPVKALKQFLRKAPPREPLPAAWLGFRGVAAHEGPVAGVRVIAVDPRGPAASAGLRAAAAGRQQGGGAEPMGADLVVAVDDVPVTTEEEMEDAINRIALAPAATPRSARLLVYGAGKFREVTLPLHAPAPAAEARPAPAQPSAAPAPSPAPAPAEPPSAPPRPGATPSKSPAVGKETPPQSN